MKFALARRLGLDSERTRAERRRIRRAGERRRIENARLAAAAERIKVVGQRSVQSTIDKFLARHARIQPPTRSER